MSARPARSSARWTTAARASAAPGRARRAAASLAAYLTLAVGTALPGCVSGSLATSTGPRAPGEPWSLHARPQAHVGEEVRFDFVLFDEWQRFVDPTGRIDYCVLLVGDDRHETAPDRHGHCTFGHRFEGYSPGVKVPVTAAGYLQQQSRDYMNIAGRWHRNESPYDEPDRRVAAASLTMTLYVTPIRFRLVRPPDELDPATGVLRIRRGDGTVTSVFLDQPGRPGFSFAGPDAAGYYQIEYTPRGFELNTSGTTEVTLTIHDRAGQRHEHALTLETP